MFGRDLTRHIEQGLASNSAVAILGPRQVGKTTLAHLVAEKRDSVYLDLENPDDFEKLANPVQFLNMHSSKLVILDEVQRYPDLFMSLRGVIDQRRRDGNGKGNFLLLGSASNDLLQQSSESLAGRITYLELSGLDPFEVQANSFDDITQLWMRGGFPESFSASDDSSSMQWRKDFIRTYLERDIPMLGSRVPANTLMRFWTMLAHSQGETLNASKLGTSLDISNMSIGRYLDMMVDLLLVRKLEPWTGNVKKRLVKAPRTYIRDSGILHSLLNITDYEQLLSHPMYGKSWEGFVMENILSTIPSSMHASFYRTQSGAEIDLVLEVEYGKYWAIEMKAPHKPKLTKGFHIACEDLNVERKFVIYGGEEAYPMQDDVMVMPLMGFLDTLK